MIMVERAKISNGKGDRVTVALKLPQGLILKLYRMVDYQQATAGGTFVTMKRAEQVGNEVTLNGYHTSVGPGQPAGMTEPFGLTHGVDREFFDTWLAQNHDSDLVRSGLIFAAASSDTIAGMSKEREAIRTGLEPMAPSTANRDGTVTHHDPRIRSLSNRGMTVATENA